MGDDIQPQVRTLLQHAVQLQEQGSFSEAILHASQACDLARHKLSKEPIYLAQCLDTLAKLYDTIGDYRQAAPLYRESLQILRTIVGNVHPEIARVANRLAELYRETGAFTQAGPLYQEALEVLNAIGEGESIGAATIEQNLALLYSSLGNNRQASQLLESALARAIALLGEEDPEVAISKDNLGNIYALLGEHERAEQLCLQALNILSKYGKPSDAAICLMNLATIYRDMGKVELAIPRYQQAMEIEAELFGKNHPQYAASANLLGALYLDLGQYANAEPLLRQALATRELTLGEAHPAVGESLQMVAFLCALTSREEEALQLLERRAAVDERLLDINFFGGSVGQRIEYLNSLPNKTNIFLSLVLKFLPTVPTAAQRGLVFLMRRKALSVNAMAIPRDATTANSREELPAKIKELLEYRTELFRSIVIGPVHESMDEYRDRCQAYSAYIEAVEADVARLVPALSLHEQLQSINLPAVAEALPEDSALIEFAIVARMDFGAKSELVRGPLHYLVFVLPASEPEQVQLLDLGEAKPINEMIDTYRLSVTGGDRAVGPFIVTQPTSGKKKNNKTEQHRKSRRHLSIGSFKQAPISPVGTTLRQLIFDPLSPAIGKRNRLILSLDGELLQLPFEILPLHDNRYLLEQYQVSYVTVGHDLVHFRQQAKGQLASSMVVADPNFDLGGAVVEELPGLTSQHPPLTTGLANQLPGSRLEGKHIANLLGVAPLLGDDALAVNLKSCHSPLVLHIATHGYFIPEYYPMSGLEVFPSDIYLDDIRDLPDGRFNWFWRQLLQTSPSPFFRSGLLLAGFNTWLRGGDPSIEAEQGILTAADVLNMDLEETQLVVLSACDTGVGQVIDHQGVFGLRRAFLLAGARTLVISLWKVPDQQTQELMIDFYRRVLAGQPPAVALRAAQMAMRAVYPNPFYWGAFICQGDSNQPLSY